MCRRAVWPFVLGLLVSAAASAAEFRVEEATIAGIHEAMRSGDVTAQILVERYIERIEAYDKKGPAINAVILVNPEALHRARELDREYQRVGFTGPLHGIPVLLKDNVETADMPTTAGSLSLEGWTPPGDAFIVRKMRSAGAIILAKVNLTEFAATGITRSSLGGQTLNPYDLGRTPGGSSGGTGAGLAANFGVIGIGTDTVNSIRSPSSANSVVGIRPTRGLVSRSGIIPYALTQDMAGPLARTVADAAAFLEAISGYDADDATTAWSVGRLAAYSEALDSDALSGARLGVLRSFFGSRPQHREVTRVTEQAIAAMRQLGADTVELEERIDADDLITNVSVGAYEFNAHLSAYLTEREAATRTLGAVVASGKYEPVLKGVFEGALERSPSEPEYTNRLMHRERLRERVMKIMADHRLDAIVYPHQKRLVVPIGDNQVDRNGVLASVTGFPAVTVPGGFSEPTSSAPIGVPIGLEFLGRPFSESTLIGLAHAFEQATKHRRAPESAPSLR